jgi:hypothetical protein
MVVLPGSRSTMSPATRLLPPSRGIALLIAAVALTLLVGLGSRTMASSPATGSATSTWSALELDAGDVVFESTTAEHAQRLLPRLPLAGPTSLVVAILALAAAVATGLRYTISSVPDAGRATSGLRPPPLLRA